MGWGSEYQESLAFKSEPATQALEMELQAPGMASKVWERAKSYRDELHKSDSWDPVMTSRLRSNNNNNNNNASFVQTAASSMTLGGGFSKSSDDAVAAIVAAGMDHSLDSSNNSAGGILPASSSPVTVVLNAPSSAGAAATKVSKKRSRASRRPPTTVLEADSANFRSMVQHLTGIPAPPPMLASTLRSSRFDFLSGGGLVRPQPTRALSFAHHATPGLSPAIDNSSGSGSGAFFQYQPPYSLRKLDDFRSFSYAPRGSQGAYMEPGSSAGVFSSMQGTSSSALINARASSSSATAPDGVYVTHSGNSTSSNLSMPSLWECDNRDGEASFNARIKQEVEEARGSGRPIVSWSTGNF